MRIPDSTLIPAPGSQDPQPLLDSPNLTKYEDYGKDFVTGVSLRASFRPRRYLTLFAAFPYLGLGTANVTGSLSLRQYRYLGTAPSDQPVDVGDARERILVNQGWFFIFDNSSSPV